jgi:hypothetical protein
VNSDLTVVKIAARLPAGERNGLNALAAQLKHFENQPGKTFPVLLMVSVEKMVTTVSTGETTAMLRICRAEAIGRQDYADAEQLITRALERRTGQPTLPENIRVELAEAFDDDPHDPGGGR